MIRHGCPLDSCGLFGVLYVTTCLVGIYVIIDLQCKVMLSTMEKVYHPECVTHAGDIHMHCGLSNTWGLKKDLSRSSFHVLYE